MFPGLYPSMDIGLEVQCSSDSSLINQYNAVAVFIGRIILFAIVNTEEKGATSITAAALTCSWGVSSWV